jgi:hypothetical protein
MTRSSSKGLDPNQANPYLDHVRSIRLLERIQHSNFHNIRFTDLIRLARDHGLTEVRHRGSHHILIHPDVGTPLNLQEVSGMAKPYQVRQFRDLVVLYNLLLGEKP